jgi:predicted transcriptional regulator
MMNLVSEEMRKFIIDLYREGNRSQKLVAELVGTTQGNVSKVLAKARGENEVIPRRCVTARRWSDRRRVYAASQVGSLMQPLDLDEI